MSFSRCHIFYRTMRCDKRENIYEEDSMYSFFIIDSGFCQG